MNFLRLKNKYEERMAKIKKWKKFKEPDYLKNARKTTIAIGILLLIVLFLILWIFKGDIEKQEAGVLSIYVFFVLYSLGLILYLEIKSNTSSNAKKVINDFDMQRLKSLKRLLIKENISFDNVDKLQIIVDGLESQKYKNSLFYKPEKYIANPFMMFIIPLIAIVFDNTVQHEQISTQINLVLYILAGTLFILIGVNFIISQYKALKYQKYDDFILDLKLLQMLNE